jgi:hypothetical protein
MAKEDFVGIGSLMHEDCSSPMLRLRGKVMTNTIVKIYRFTVAANTSRS